jgi:hypothetical protein
MSRRFKNKEKHSFILCYHSLFISQFAISLALSHITAFSPTFGEKKMLKICARKQRIGKKEYEEAAKFFPLTCLLIVCAFFFAC